MNDKLEKYAVSAYDENGIKIKFKKYHDKKEMIEEANRLLRFLPKVEKLTLKGNKNDGYNWKAIK